MYLFLNTITRPATILLFSRGEVVAREQFDISGHEFDDLLEKIEGFLSSQNQSVPTLEGIVTICGPGGFTSTRIVSLIVNTWHSLYHIPTQSLTLFDLFERSGGIYPMCVKANRGEYLVLATKDGVPTIFTLADMPEGPYTGIGDVSDFADKKISIQSNIDYDMLIADFHFVAEEKNIEPYYIKKPNIT